MTRKYSMGFPHIRAVFFRLLLPSVFLANLLSFAGQTFAAAYGSGTYDNAIQASKNAVILSGDITVNFNSQTPGSPAVIASDQGTITGTVDNLNINLSQSFLIGMKNTNGGQITLAGPVQISSASGLSQNYGVISYSPPGIEFDGPVAVNIVGNYSHGVLSESGPLTFNQPLTINHSGTASYGVRVNEEHSGGSSTIQLNGASSVTTNGERSIALYLNGGTVTVNAPLTVVSDANVNYAVKVSAPYVQSSLSTRLPNAPDTANPQVIRLQGKIFLTTVQNRILLDLAAGSNIDGPVNIGYGSHTLYFYSPSAQWSMGSGSLIMNNGKMSLNFVEGGVWEVPLAEANKGGVAGTAPLQILNGGKLTVSGKGVLSGNLLDVPTQNKDQQFVLVEAENNSGAQLDINLSDLTPQVSNPNYTMTLSMLNQGGSEYLIANLAYTPSIPMTPLTPATPIVHWTPLTPATPIVPMTPLVPATPIVPMTPLVPATPVVHWTPLTPATPIIPLISLNPSSPVVPLTPLNPSRPIVPSIPLNPSITTENIESPPPVLWRQPVPDSWLDQRLASGLTDSAPRTPFCNDMPDSEWIGVCLDQEQNSKALWLLPFYDRVVGSDLRTNSGYVGLHGNLRGLGLQIVQPIDQGALSAGGFMGSGRFHTENSATPIDDDADYRGGFIGVSRWQKSVSAHLNAIYLQGQHRLKQEVLQGWQLDTKFHTHIAGTKAELQYSAQYRNWQLAPYVAFAYWRVNQNKSALNVNDIPVFSVGKTHQNLYQLLVGVHLRGENLLDHHSTRVIPLIELGVTPTWGQRQRKALWMSNFRNVASVDVIEPEIDRTSVSGGVGFQLDAGQLNGYFRYRANKSQHLYAGQVSADLVWSF